jgi:hypothetical protein
MHIDQIMHINTIMLGHTNSKVVKNRQTTQYYTHQQHDIMFDTPNWQVMVIFFKLSGYHVVSEYCMFDLNW